MEEIRNPLIFDLSTEGLEPAKHRIVGITCKSMKEEQIFASRNEREALVAFWEYVKANSFDKLIGFNSDEFDVPMLIIRSMKYKIPMEHIADRHLDLRKVLFFGGERKKGTLKEFGELLGVKNDDHGYGKIHMYLLWSRPDLPNIRDCLLGDVRITWALFEHAKEAQII